MGRDITATGLQQVWCTIYIGAWPHAHNLWKPVHARPPRLPNAPSCIKANPSHSRLTLPGGRRCRTSLRCCMAPAEQTEHQLGKGPVHGAQVVQAIPMDTLAQGTTHFWGPVPHRAGSSHNSIRCLSHAPHQRPLLLQPRCASQWGRCSGVVAHIGLCTRTRQVWPCPACPRHPATHLGMWGRGPAPAPASRTAASSLDMAHDDSTRAHLPSWLPLPGPQSRWTQCEGVATAARQPRCLM